jgi:hypothetical protein
MARGLRAAAAALLLTVPGTAQGQPRDCLAALVLALDVSASVDAAEYEIQMRGLADALVDPEVMAAILPWPGAGIMASAFVWSGFQHQEIVTPWAWLGSEAEIAAFAEALRTAPRVHDYWPTALGRATVFAAGLHRDNPVPCRRRIVDVSGDGVNNDGPPPSFYRAQGFFDGLTINGLVIRGAVPDPLEHYRDQVLHGPGAFLEVAETFEAYPPAILRKLLRELQPMLGRAE